MSDQAPLSFGSQDDLLHYLELRAAPRGGFLVLVAGRFRLAPIAGGDRLIPLIAENAAVLSRERPCEPGSEAPLRTLRLGARLLHHAAVSSSARGQLLVLVQDHGFLPAAAGSPGVGDRHRLEEALRRKFYLGAPSVPAAFRQVLAEEGLSPQDALFPCEEALGGGRPAAGAGSLLHSEELLRDRFERHARADLMASAILRDRFPAAGEIARQATGEAACAFGPEVAQLLLDLVRRDVTEVVLFVGAPEAPAAALGVDLGLALATLRRVDPPVVHLVSLAEPDPTRRHGREDGPIRVLTRAA